MVKWICLSGGCIYARVQYAVWRKPDYASSKDGSVQVDVAVYCLKKYVLIKKAVERCGDFQNRRLM
jgi:hypothetical protein